MKLKGGSSSQVVRRPGVGVMLVEPWRSFIVVHPGHLIANNQLVDRTEKKLKRTYQVGTRDTSTSQAPSIESHPSGPIHPGS